MTFFGLVVARSVLRLSRLLEFGVSAKKLLWRSPKRPERPMGISGAGHLTDVHVNKQRPRLDILLDSHDESHSTFSKGIDGVWLTADLGWHIICGNGQS